MVPSTANEPNVVKETAFGHQDMIRSHPISLSALQIWTSQPRKLLGDKHKVSYYDMNIKDNKSSVCTLKSILFISKCFCNIRTFPFIVGEALWVLVWHTRRVSVLQAALTLNPSICLHVVTRKHPAQQRVSQLSIMGVS